MAAALADGAWRSRDALDRLPALTGVRGRMELAARLANGAAVYVDYAHTPDALERLLTALRPHTDGRLHVVFGAGGDRDPGKRPLMGAAAARLADVAIVTDDNPRSEDPAAIRAAVLAGLPAARARSATARRRSPRRLPRCGPGDVLAVAGKGHEQGQTVGGTVLPFDDVAVDSPAGRCWHDRALVCRRTLVRATRRRNAHGNFAAVWRFDRYPRPCIRATCSSRCAAKRR